MKATALVTFGCSWTAGVGVCYEPNMRRDKFEENLYNDKGFGDTYSFRALLSKKYGFTNINFAQGGSSNQKQFRYAKEFFVGNNIKHLFDMYEKIIVLHGITSTARNELFINELNRPENFTYQQDTPWAKAIVKLFYNHDYEVDCLYREMNFFDTFYASIGITNFWFDTFNHHNYLHPSTNLIGLNDTRRDLLSKISAIAGMDNPDDQYHESMRVIDTNRLEGAIDTGYLNPFTYHPTKKGHQFIAELIDEYLDTNKVI